MSSRDAGAGRTRASLARPTAIRRPQTQGIWGLTLLPRPWVSPVCELLGKGPYIGKRLVSLGELRRLRSEAFEGVKILGRPANPDARSLPGKLYARLAPASERLIDQICPEHTVLAQRAGRIPEGCT